MVVKISYFLQPLTSQAHRPDVRNIKTSSLQAGDIVLLHVHVPLKVCVFCRTFVAHIVAKLYWCSIPFKYQVCLYWWLGEMLFLFANIFSYEIFYG